MRDFKKRLFIYLAGFPVLALSLIFFYNVLKTGKPLDFQLFSGISYSTGTFSGVLEQELEECGVSETDKRGVIKAFTGKIDFRKLGERDSYAIAFSSADFKYITIEKGTKNYSVFKKEGKYSFSETAVPVDAVSYEASGKIKDNLWEAMSSEDVPAETILDFTDIFAWTVDFLTEVRAGDKFRVFYEIEKTKNGRIISQKITAAMYEGSEAGRKIAVEFKGNYYNENGEGARSMFLRAPLSYRRISSRFTLKRYHPVLKYVRPHLGIDYAAGTGTPVSSVADGTVVWKGWKGGYGNFIEVKHSSGYITSYGHLSRYARGLRTGRRVSQGQVIGYVGSTGISTGPHLDFRIRQNGKFINYLKMKYKAISNLPKKYLSEFSAKVKRYFPD
ncbi:MAG: hypothetical protein COT17_05335 [Elusimicrobia bacterium CG08_land_8_20_14_0_20_51_18]|nr:MAG: hypothetical protein COT17_05335 [Elusimicrobia bacterium CG08_land_8_20_14_0_20_51_18]